MPYLIGTDEAGYGPNLGPLLVGATVWKVPDLDSDLYSLLGDAVTAQPAKSAGGKLCITDSKLVYKPKGTLAGLERALFSTLPCKTTPSTWRELWASLVPDSDIILSHVPWYESFDLPLPLDAVGGDVSESASFFGDTCSDAGVQLVAVRCKAVFPEEFNRVADELGSKGALLSQVTLGLIRDLMDSLPQDSVRISCDKHGGRNNYAPVLQETFPGQLFQVIKESRPESTYRWQHGQHKSQISFIMKGESFLPSALASIAAKYLREMAMKAVNAFWQDRIPDLKPTAGYPQDAKRYREEIRSSFNKLRIHEDILWRRR